MKIIKFGIIDEQHEDWADLIVHPSQLRALS